TPRWRRRVPENLEQIVDRREISILRSGRREGFALPRLASDRCSVARAFRATGALSKTPVLRGHLDNLVIEHNPCLFHLWRKCATKLLLQAPYQCLTKRSEM